MKKLTNLFIVLIVLLVSCSDDDGDSLIANSAPSGRDCDSTHLLVGESRELAVSNIYGISGVVTIVSDCEIEISNFFYNGLGPNVSVYGGTNSDFEAGINLSEPINGRSFQGETLNLFLPEDTTFDEINSFSIWCFEFNIDFSSASFQ